MDDGKSNGTKSDDAVSIQKMVNPNMLGQNLVTPNMGCLEPGYSEHG